MPSKLEGLKYLGYSGLITFPLLLLSGCGDVKPPQTPPKDITTLYKSKSYEYMTTPTRPDSVIFNRDSRPLTSILISEGFDLETVQNSVSALINFVQSMQVELDDPVDFEFSYLRDECNRIMVSKNGYPIVASNNWGIGQSEPDYREYVVDESAATDLSRAHGHYRVIENLQENSDDLYYGPEFDPDSQEITSHIAKAIQDVGITNPMQAEMIALHLSYVIKDINLNFPKQVCSATVRIETNAAGEIISKEEEGEKIVMGPEPEAIPRAHLSISTRDLGIMNAVLEFDGEFYTYILEDAAKED